MGMRIQDNHTVDRIDITVRFDDDAVARLNDKYRTADTHSLLTAVLCDGVAGRAAVVSSFGAESAVLLSLISEIAPETPVLFLDTGKHFAETYAYRDLLARHLNLQNIINLVPQADQITARDGTGLRWSYDPDGCCEMRKVQPLARSLINFDASITGRKAFQSTTRAGLERFEIDRTDKMGRLKINPLADWSGEMIAEIFSKRNLPQHKMVAQGFLSIGCSPCTSRVAKGEDPRAGRWRGWDKTECGIHLSDKDAGESRDLPSGFEPAF